MRRQLQWWGRVLIKAALWGSVVRALCALFGTSPCAGLLANAYAGFLHYPELP